MRNVFTIIDEMASGLAELKSALQPLAVLAATNGQRPRQVRETGRTRGRRRASPKATTAAASATSTTKVTASKPGKPVSPKVRAMRVQQGKYLAALRGLTVQQRAQVKKAKAEGDYGAALKVAEGLARKTA